MFCPNTWKAWNSNFLRQQVLSPVPHCHHGEIKIFKLQYYVWKLNVACYNVCSNSDLLRRDSNVYYIIYLYSESVLPKVQMYPWKSKGCCYRELCSFILHSPSPIRHWRSHLLTSVMKSSSDFSYGQFLSSSKILPCSIRTARSLACIPSKIHVTQEMLVSLLLISWLFTDTYLLKYYLEVS